MFMPNASNDSSGTLYVFLAGFIVFAATRIWWRWQNEKASKVILHRWTGTRVKSELPIAVRVYPDLKPSQPERKAPQIDGMLVFDCETRTDRAQTLTFGSYRFLVAGRCLEEGLFYADDLTADERERAGTLRARALRRHRSARHS